jgi:hypothetical protein
MLELIYEKSKIKTQEEMERVNGLKQKVDGTYEKIPNVTQRVELIAVENIDQFV